MTDSYKVRTSQLPNFHDENMKRNEEQKTFPSSSSIFIPSFPRSWLSVAIKLFVKFYLLDRKSKAQCTLNLRCTKVIGKNAEGNLK